MQGKSVKREKEECFPSLKNKHPEILHNLTILKQYIFPPGVCVCAQLYAHANMLESHRQAHTVIELYSVPTKSGLTAFKTMSKNLLNDLSGA